MKSLEEYIKEQEKEFWRTYPSLYLHCEPPYWDLERRNEWIDWFFEGIECPINVIEAAKDYENDPILEMLNTHSISKLIENIKKLYNDIDIQRVNGTDDTKPNINEEPKDGFWISNKEKNKLENILKDGKFINLIEFYNYYFTQFNYDRDNDIWLALFEPRYSKKIIDYKERNNGVAYHITTRKIYESNIKKNGLKVKDSNSNKRKGYRYYPKRIYMILPNVSSSKERDEIIYNVIKTLKKENDYVILQISLWDLENFTFYEDVTMNTNKEHYIYTYQNIPAKYIKDITYKFNN